MGVRDLFPTGRRAHPVALSSAVALAHAFRPPPNGLGPSNGGHAVSGVGPLAELHSGRGESLPRTFLVARGSANGGYRARDNRAAPSRLIARFGDLKTAVAPYRRLSPGAHVWAPYGTSNMYNSYL